jgi:hypothetical protein
VAQKVFGILGQPRRHRHVPQVIAVVVHVALAGQHVKRRQHEDRPTELTGQQ